MRSGSRWHPCRARTSAPACRLHRCRSSPWRVTQPGPIVTVRALTERRLARIARTDPAINAFTDVTAARALAEAEAVDRAVAASRDPGPRAGVPVAVKNLVDVAGLPTRAGSKIKRDRAPASADAVLLARLTAAGAVLTGTLNMGEYAYDFTGENAHDGAAAIPTTPGG